VESAKVEFDHYLSFKGKDAFEHQRFAELHAERIIDLKYRYRYPPDCGAADEQGLLPTEVPRPLLTAGVEQGCQQPGLGV
jgi:hypothetical protein